jgi:hypothetical protein
MTNVWRPFYNGVTNPYITQAPFPPAILSATRTKPTVTVLSWSSSYLPKFYNENPISTVAKYSFKYIMLEAIQIMLSGTESLLTLATRISPKSYMMANNVVGVTTGPLLPFPFAVDEREIYSYPLFYPAIILALENAGINVITYSPAYDAIYLSTGALPNQTDEGFYGLVRVQPEFVTCNSDSTVEPYTSACFKTCMRKDGMGNCDKYMTKYCQANPTSEACACMTSPAVSKIGGVQYNPVCVDAKCFGSGYQTAAMLSAGKCPIVSCTAQVELKASKLPLIPINLEQNCGGVGSATSYTTAGGPVSISAVANPNVAATVTPSQAAMVKEDPTLMYALAAGIALLVISIVVVIAKKF